MSIDLETLGLDKNELQGLIVERVAKCLLTDLGYDCDGDEEPRVSHEFVKKIKGIMIAHINETVNNLAKKYVLPNLTKHIETLPLKKTNMYGESKGEPMTFVEYLTDLAEKWIGETVNDQGRPKRHSESYWRGTQTRLAYIIDDYLHHSIETTMKNVIGNANKILVSGLRQTVEMKLKEISKSLEVNVKI